MAFDVRLLEPAVEFLRSTEPKLRAKAFRTIELLKDFGPELPMPHARKLSGQELFELRVRQGSNICRLFYFVEGESVFIVTSGYIKKTDKTDRREIERALRLKAEYLQGEEK
jgi:phage-related protein